MDATDQQQKRYLQGIHIVIILLLHKLEEEVVGKYGEPRAKNPKTLRALNAGVEGRGTGPRPARSPGCHLGVPHENGPVAIGQRPMQSEVNEAGRCGYQARPRRPRERHPPFDERHERHAESAQAVKRIRPSFFLAPFLAYVVLSNSNLAGNLSNYRYR